MLQSSSVSLQPLSRVSTSNNPPASRTHLFPFNSTFSSPLLSLSASRTPDAEHYIVLDRSRGFIYATIAQASELAELGHDVFDLAGYRVIWDPPLVQEQSKE